jgi:hypothetical protein
LITDHDYIQSELKGALQWEALIGGVNICMQFIICSKIKILHGSEAVKQLHAYPYMQINL